MHLIQKAMTTQNTSASLYRHLKIFKLSQCEISGQFSFVLENALVKPKKFYPNDNFPGWIERIVADTHTFDLFNREKSLLSEQCSLAFASKNQRHESVIDQMGR